MSAFTGQQILVRVFDVLMKSAIVRKLASLQKYRRLFIDWRTVAFMRYRQEKPAEPTRLRMRNGKAIWFRPRFDPVALGEIFVAESYGEFLSTATPKRIWDIGGNIGCFAIWMLLRNPGAQITSFEPCEDTFDILTKNREEWKDCAWDIRPFGLSDRDETVSAFVPFESYGQTSRHAANGIPTQLTLRNIATVWAEEGRPDIDLLKIDCEGDEYEILAAIPDEMWKSVSALVIEVHPRMDKSPDELKSRLEAHGFCVVVGHINSDLWFAEARSSAKSPP